MTQHILTRLGRLAKTVFPGKAWAIRSSMLTASARSPQPQQGVNLASESVAGEEDPGASLDMTLGASAPGSDGSAAPRPGPVSEPPAGTPGTGEGICRECGGSGLLAGAVMAGVLVGRRLVRH